MQFNIKKKGNETPKGAIKDNEKKDGLDSWNSRLDENLETNNNNNTEADKKAKDFFEKNEELKER